MLAGYIWTSDTDAQEARERQHQALLSAGVAIAHIYEDVNCTYRGPRPQLDSCLQALQAHDTLVICHLDGLAHSRSALLKVLEVLAQRQIGLRVLEGKGAIINTVQVDLDVVIGVIDALTEFEERTVRVARAKGIAEARARGQAFGPKRKVTADIIRQAMDYMVNSDMSVSQIAETLGIKRTSLYTYLNGDGSPKASALALLASEGDSDVDEASAGDSSSSSTNRRKADE